MSKAGKIVWKLIKAFFWLIIFAVNVIMLWRVLFSGDPSEIKPILVNEQTLSAYEKVGDELRLEVQMQRTITESGRFSVTDCVFIPEAEQIQITVRYNNSTLRKLTEDFELEKMPNREEELFDVTLVKTVDLTPENPEDNTIKSTLREERYYPSAEPKTAYKTLYSYRKFIFDNVSYEDAVGMFVDIYYVGDKDYTDTPYDALCIYDALMDIEARELSGADKRALKKASALLEN